MRKTHKDEILRVDSTYNGNFRNVKLHNLSTEMVVLVSFISNILKKEKFFYKIVKFFNKKPR